MKCRDLLLERKKKMEFINKSRYRYEEETLYTVMNKQQTEEMGHSTVYFPRR